MIFEQLAGNLIQGLVLGAIYGMATMGLSLIFGVLKVVNVGHGAFIMVGAFVTLWLFNALGIIPIFAIPVALIIGLALGFLFYYTVMRRLIKAPELATLLATFSMGVLLEETIKLMFTDQLNGVAGEFRFGLGFAVGEVIFGSGERRRKAAQYSWGGYASTDFRLVPDAGLFQIFVRQRIPSSHDLANMLFAIVYEDLY